MDLRINGVDIALYPSEFECVIRDLDYNNSSEFGRAIDGTINRNRIAVKRTLTMTFNAAKWSEVSALLQQMTDEFFTIYYPDILTGQYETKTFYVADRPSRFVKSQANTSNEFYWTGGVFTFVEK